MINEKSVEVYFLHSIVGAILFALLYYFSLQKNSIICALIPALPILGFFGLYYVYYNKSNIEEYLKNIIVFFILYVLLFSMIYGLYIYNNNIVLSTIISFILFELISSELIHSI